MSHYRTSVLQDWIQKHCCHPRGQDWAGSQRSILKQVQSCHGNTAAAASTDQPLANEVWGTVDFFIIYI